MKNRPLKAVVKELEARKSVLKKYRDDLNDYVAEIEELVSNCDDGLAALHEAVEALSRLV